VVVASDRAKARRQRVEARRLGCEVQPRRVRAAHDLGEPLQRRIYKAVLVQEGAEGATLPVVADFDTGA